MSVEVKWLHRGLSYLIVHLETLIDVTARHVMIYQVVPADSALHSLARQTNHVQNLRISTLVQAFFDVVGEPERVFPIPGQLLLQVPLACRAEVCMVWASQTQIFSIVELLPLL